MTSIKYFPFITLAFTALAGMTRGQTASDLNEGSQLTHDPGTDAFSFSWWGRSGRTYFLQQSEDLASWQYLPLIEAGQEGIVQWGFSTNADRLFLRLKHTDIPTLDPLADDFDGDNISNWNELLQESDPLAALDWNTNGIPDDWELFWDSEIAVFPTPLELDLDWGTQAPRSLYLNNPTATAANYSVALTGDTVSGYSWEDSQTGTIAYVWTDISTTGTALASIANVDSDSEKITLSQFAFPYYGRNHGEIWVCSNGYLNFKQEYNDSSNDELPDYYSPYGVIAPFWNDLHTGDGGDIYYKEETNRLIVQYEAVAKDDGSGANTFQIILNADGSIEFHYKQMDGDLDECSVGIQNVSRNQGIQLRYNTDASNLVSLQYSYAIRFNPTKTLFTLALLNGNVASATAAELIATFDAENVIPGTYTGSLAITHDGTGTSPWNVPVQVNIPYAKMTEPNSGYTLWEGKPCPRPAPISGRSSLIPRMKSILWNFASAIRSSERIRQLRMTSINPTGQMSRRASIRFLHASFWTTDKPMTPCLSWSMSPRTPMATVWMTVGNKTISEDRQRISRLRLTSTVTVSPISSNTITAPILPILCRSRYFRPLRIPSARMRMWVQ